MTNKMKNVRYKFMKFLNIILFYFFFLFYSLVLSMMTDALAESDKITIFFYSSESNINNFKSLKSEFDNYLSRLGPYEFQPFSERETFENHVKGKKRCIFLISSWHYKNIYKAYSLRPFLVGVRNGKIYNKRILVCASHSSATLNSAKTGRIASASSIQHTKSVLTDIFKDKQVAESAKILTVPKDIDALMSVGFGMSQFALATKSSLDKLKVVNPMIYKKITFLAEGKPSPLLILAVPEPFAKESEKSVKIISDMQIDPNGKDKIKMLGLDGWQKIDSEIRLKLEG